MSATAPRLLAYYALSQATHAAHDAAIDAGDIATADELHRFGERVLSMLGQLVVAESKRAKAVEVTS